MVLIILIIEINKKWFEDLEKKINKKKNFFWSRLHTLTFTNQ